MTHTLRPAAVADSNPILELLECAGLPTAGVGASLEAIYVCEVDGVFAGAAGLEVHAGDGLLRSLAVVPGYRRQGVAAALCERIMDHARGAGCGAVYLLTLDASGYFKKLGFETIARNLAPPGIRESSEFSDLCPASAVLMRRSLFARGQ